MNYRRADASHVGKEKGVPNNVPPAWKVLVQNAVTGDTQSVRHLLQTIAPVVRRTCRGVLGTEHPDVEDAIQESLIAITRALPAWHSNGEFPHYAAKISLRVALSTRRRVRRQPSLIQEALAGESDHASAAREHDVGLLAERSELLRFLIQDLASEQAETLMLRFFLGYSLEETASIMNVPLNTAKTRIRLAKKVLRRRIEANRRAFALFGKRSK